MRVFQIILFYQKYVDGFYYDKIETLQRTIHGLTLDISKLITRNKNIINDVSGASSSEEECSCNKNSFVSDSNSYKSDYLKYSESDSPRMESQYMIWTPQGSPKTPTGDIPIITSDIHQELINILEIPNELSSQEFDIRSDRTSLPISTIGDRNHIDILRRRFSTFLYSGDKKYELARDTFA
jgi:hypothetical protein